jgi:hypothetical protein
MRAQQVLRSGEFDLACSADEAFPLFSPEGERCWVAGWNPQPVFPERIAFARDTVFRQGEGDEQAIWTIVDLDPVSHRAEYVRVASASHTAHIVVKIDPVNQTKSHVTVTYAITVFGTSGSSSLLDQFSKSSYAEKMRSWQRQISQCMAIQLCS